MAITEIHFDKFIPLWMGVACGGLFLALIVALVLVMVTSRRSRDEDRASK